VRCRWGLWATRTRRTLGDACLNSETCKRDKSMTAGGGWGGCTRCRLGFACMSCRMCKLGRTNTAVDSCCTAPDSNLGLVLQPAARAYVRGKRRLETRNSHILGLCSWKSQTLLGKRKNTRERCEKVWGGGEGAAARLLGGLKRRRRRRRRCRGGGGGGGCVRVILSFNLKRNRNAVQTVKQQQALNFPMHRVCAQHLCSCHHSATARA
jgi:hypothetical protein